MQEFLILEDFFLESSKIQGGKAIQDPQLGDFLAA